MHRSPWELEAYARARIASLAVDRRAAGTTDAAPPGTGAVPRLRREIGFGLIRVGNILAGQEAAHSPAAPRVGPPAPLTP